MRTPNTEKKSQKLFTFLTSYNNSTVTYFINELLISTLDNYMYISLISLGHKTFHISYII